MISAPWSKVAVGDLLSHPLRNGISPSNKGTVTAEVLTLSAVTGSRFDPGAKKTAQFESEHAQEKTICRADLLICRGNGNIGLVGRARRPRADMPDVAFPDTMIGASFDLDRVDLTFLEYLWDSHVVRSQVEESARSTNGTHKINQGMVESIEIPLPPIEEQRRIAAVLDAADDLRAKRREALAAIKRLRDAVVAECLQQYAERVPLGHHLEFVTSGSRGWAKYYSETGSRFIRSQDVGLGQILDDDPAFVSPPDGAEARRTRVRKGDLLVTITGTVGRVTAADDDLVGSHISQHVAIARPSDSLRPKFAEAFMCFLPGQTQLERAQYGQTKPGLNLTQIREFQLPVPTLGEQDGLLARLDAISQEKSRFDESRHRLEGLFASLQQRAFRGEL